MFYMFISIAAGAIVVISRILNTKLSEKVGLINSSFYNYLTAILAATFLFFISKESFKFNELNTLPFYAYLGGALGVIIVILSSVITPKMSSFSATLLIFIGQLFTGIILDCLISRTVSFPKIIGGLFVVIGLAYNLHIDAYKNTKTKIK